ncbi:MAG: hypothetical protein KGJ13_11285, partial [Patescibacteria group bacterium]|nr:hypothetical protein [Patescibacteria group bacterium]
MAGEGIISPEVKEEAERAEKIIAEMTASRWAQFKTKLRFISEAANETAEEGSRFTGGLFGSAGIGAGAGIGAAAGAPLLGVGAVPGGIIGAAVGGGIGYGFGRMFGLMLGSISGGVEASVSALRNSERYKNWLKEEGIRKTR